MYWIAFGDLHDHPEHAALIPGLAEARALIVTGDLTNRGGEMAARTILDELASHNPAILAQAGNMDTAAVTTFLESRGANIHRKCVNLLPDSEKPVLGLIGVGWSTPTPFGTPSETTEEELALWLDEVYAEAQGYEHLVLVSHDPPRGTRCDQLSGGQHVGSAAVRRFIERVQPDICLAGHIHESRAEDTIGRTHVLNPGILSGGGYVRLTWDGERPAARLETL